MARYYVTAEVGFYVKASSAGDADKRVASVLVRDHALVRGPKMHDVAAEVVIADVSVSTSTTKRLS